MNTEPICIYKNQEELDASLQEWQTRLFLDDWIIKAELFDLNDMPDGKNLGFCTHYDDTKAAFISIAKLSPEEASNELIKPCHERVLVHELMHCKRLSFATDSESIQDAEFRVSEHAHIEQMAKSLLMAKCGVGLDWFKNF